MQRWWSAVLVLALGVTGCTGTEYAVGSAALAGGTFALGRTPGHELEQVYYFGVFDPLEQMPPLVYRVTVRGQASTISAMRFASGWVPANVADSLGTRLTAEKSSGNISISGADGEHLAKLETGRRLVLFGPEGFREAPKDHRLVIVMGSDADEFFGAIDEALGTVARAQAGQQSAALQRALVEALMRARNDRERLDDLASDIRVDLAGGD